MKKKMIFRTRGKYYKIFSRKMIFLKIFLMKIILRQSKRNMKEYSASSPWFDCHSLKEKTFWRETKLRNSLSAAKATEEFYKIVYMGREL
jgi:hypothetical protein